MSTVRILPLGAPVAAGLALAGHGAIVVVSILTLVVMALVVRAIRRDQTTEPTEGPPA